MSQSPQSMATPSGSRFPVKMAGLGGGFNPTAAAPRKLQFSDDEVTELAKRLTAHGLTVSPSPALGSRASVPVGSHGPPSPQKEFRYPKPAPFSGDPDGLDYFEYQMVAYLEGIGIDVDSPSAARVAGMYLRGEASDWLVSHLRTLKASSLPEFGSWKEFLAGLTTWCCPLDPTRRHFEDLLTLRQGKLEIRTYVLQFHTIRSKLIEPLPVHFLIYLFMRGLRQELRTGLATEDPSDLGAAFALAIAFADAQMMPKLSVAPAVSKPAASVGVVPKPRDVCTHCNKPYHTAANCFLLHPELKKIMGKKPKKN